MPHWIEDNGGEDFSNNNPAWWLGCMLILVAWISVLCFVAAIVMWLP